LLRTVSDFLAWLPGSETVKIFEKKKGKVPKFEDSDIIFTLDFNALHRFVVKWNKS
jgi:phosphoesterase RecJ-like protein